MQSTSLADRLQHALEWHRAGQLAQAQAAYAEILAMQPLHADALNLSAALAVQMGDAPRAVALFAKAIESDPKNPAAYLNSGLALRELKQLDAALARIDQAIEMRADCADAYLNRGLVLGELGRWEAALASFEQAIAIEPDYAEAHLACAHVLQELNRLDAALHCCDRAIDIVADYEEAYVGRGTLLLMLGQRHAARESYDRAVALKPDYAAARYGRALASLSLGDFEHGLIDYEWRWAHGNRGDERDFSQPLWIGEESIAGKRILLYSEQGLGDTLQFCRYVPRVAELGAHVILETQAPLKELLAGLSGVSQIVARGDGLPEFDLRCPLLSLPLAFKTTSSTIPARVPYLTSHPDKRRFWRDALGPATKKRVGLVWSGGHRPDQPSMNARRNIPLAKLAPLARVDVDFISLQKGQPAEAELAAAVAQGWNGPPIRDLTAFVRDFSDTAALIDQLDLVIAVDTSTAHLAGALGKPVWILNRFDSCWRWLTDRTDSPWYPTATLYRQPKHQDWESVIDAVLHDLKQLCR